MQVAPFGRGTVFSHICIACLYIFISNPLKVNCILSQRSIIFEWYFTYRFIPDDMEFDEEELKESATHVPDNYEPKFFINPALGQSLVFIFSSESHLGIVSL